MVTRQSLRYYSVMLLGILSYCSPAQAVELGLKNQPEHAWVHRRANGDKDAADAYAVVLRLNSDTGDGYIWYYKGLSNDNTNYTNRATAIKVKGTASSAGSGERSRLKVTLTEDVVANPKTVGYLTLYQGKSIKKANPGQIKKRRAGQRLTFRWNAAYAAGLRAGVDPDGKLRAERVGCDEPPADDPMEEEDLDLDPMMPEDPPDEELPYDPGEA